MEIVEDELRLERNKPAKSQKYNTAFELVTVLAEVLPQFDKQNFEINVEAVASLLGLVCLVQK